jgi:hypothetical protein
MIPIIKGSIVELYVDVTSYKNLNNLIRILIMVLIDPNRFT